MQRCAQEDERIHSLLLVRSGYIVFEEYYHGWSQNKYHNVNSVTKSVTSALVGVALREKLIDTLDRPLLSFFSEYDARNGEADGVLLRHLLSLTSGLVSPPGDIDTFLEHTASLERILSRPAKHEPGQVFAYDDIDIHLVSLVLSRVTGMSTAAFALAYLFEPLGIWCDEQGEPYPWQHGKASEDTPHPWGLQDGQLLWSVDRQGNTIGAFGLQLTAREMAKFGYLYLKRGIWDGRQIIPAEYVQASIRAYSSTSKGADYGYCWYILHKRRQNAYLALGFGGQLIVCLPDLDMLFVMTAQPTIERPPAHSNVLDKGLWPLVEALEAK